MMTVDNQEHSAPQTNFERLLAHLQGNSLAARLVSAYTNPGEQTPAEAVSKVVAVRLAELKHRL